MSSTRIPIKALRQATKTALVKLGHSSESAAIMTDVLMYAEMRSNNQGLIKLVTGALGPSPKCGALSVTFESPVSAQLDGAHNSGMVVVHEAVRLGMSKAKVSGISVVGCSNYASATGALGAWAKKIADDGLIGIVMSQCNEMVAPHGSYEPIFGTNPLAISIPTQPRAQVLDMATSSWAYFGLKTAQAEGRSIPDDVAYDNQGHSTTNPTDALKGALRVFDRGYKGSHIALMVELLAGSLTGAAAEDKGTAQNWGSLVICIDPAVLGPENPAAFQQRAMEMCTRVKNAKRLPGEKGELYLPGERGDAVCAENLRLDSVPILDSVYRDLQAMA
jgi:L-2-hydroxycarboxylate dehydrogenase (NAD+)